MKVLATLYHPYALWPFSGSERRFAHVAKHLKELGVEIDAIESYPTLSRFMPVSYSFHPLKFFLQNRIYVDLLQWIVLGLRKAKELHRRNKYDLVYATTNNVYNFLLGYFISRLFSLSLVVVVHHLRWVDPLYNPRSSKLNLLSLYRKMRQNKLGRSNALVQTIGSIIESKVGRAEMCIVVSKAVKENLRELGVCSKKITVTGNAIDFDLINSFPSEEKRYDAIFVGRLDEGKGVYDLIQVWKRVVETLPNAKLVIIGSGFLQKDALKLTKNLGLTKNVKFMSFVVDEVVYRTLSASRVFVLPSKLEGWSIATAEALARGLPVVCYNIPALRENFAKCQSVFFVPVGDVDSFAERVIHLLSLKQNDHAVLKHISQSYAKRFDWHVIAQREYQALAEAMRRPVIDLSDKTEWRASSLQESK